MQKSCVITITIVGFSAFVISGCKEKSLHKAIASDCSVSEIEKLVKNGSNVNEKNQMGQTPLHEAAMTGRVYVAELLVDQGKDDWAADVGQGVTQPFIGQWVTVSVHDYSPGGTYKGSISCDAADKWKKKLDGMPWWYQFPTHMCLIFALDTTWQMLKTCP